MLRLLKLRSTPPDPASLAPPTPIRKDPLESIAEQARLGAATAERTLLRAVGPVMLQAVRSILGVHHPEVLDVCQEAHFALIQALPRFRGHCTVTHFACRIAVLTALNVRRRDNLRAEIMPNVEPETLGDSALSPGELLAVALRRQALRSLIDELPLPQAAVVAHHVMLGHTIEETAVELDAPIATVRSRLRYALGALRRRITGDPRIFEVIKGGHG